MIRECRRRAGIGGDFTIKTGGEFIPDASKITFMSGCAPVVVQGGQFNASSMPNIGRVSRRSGGSPCLVWGAKGIGRRGCPICLALFCEGRLGISVRPASYSPCQSGTQNSIIQKRPLADPVRNAVTFSAGSINKRIRAKEQMMKSTAKFEDERVRPTRGLNANLKVASAYDGVPVATSRRPLRLWCGVCHRS